MKKVFLALLLAALSMGVFSQKKIPINYLENLAFSKDVEAAGDFLDVYGFLYGGVDSSYFNNQYYYIYDFERNNKKLGCKEKISLMQNKSNIMDFSFTVTYHATKTPTFTSYKAEILANPSRSLISKRRDGNCNYSSYMIGSFDYTFTDCTTTEIPKMVILTIKFNNGKNILN